MSEPVTDTGVAWVRTRLAWRRTVLTLAAVALLAARLAVTHGIVGAIFAAVAVAGWAAASFAIMRRMRSLTTAPSDDDAVAPGTLLVGTVMVLAYMVLGLVLVAV